MIGASLNRTAAILALASSIVASTCAPALAVPHEGDAAPAFTLPAAAGGTISLAAFKGKPVYLNFFASWCVPCNEEAPGVASLYGKYRAKGFNVVGVNELEDKSKALAFAHQYKWPFPIAVDGDGAMAGSYGILGLPVHIFIDKHGKVSTFRLGEMEPPEIEAAIRKIL
jgi:peroxiredoxin